MMQKTENPVILSIILCVITGAVALLLAFSNNLTKDTILMNSQKEEQLAKEAVIEAETYKEIELSEKPDLVTDIFEAANGDEIIGYCVNVVPSGFGGEINMMVGIDLENKITGIKIISMSETAGLGSKAQDENFTGQFKGKPAKELRVIKNGTAEENEIVAISGATITSTAVKDGVNAAISAVNELTEAQK